MKSLVIPALAHRIVLNKGSHSVDGNKEQALQDLLEKVVVPK